MCSLGHLYQHQLRLFIKNGDAQAQTQSCGIRISGDGDRKVAF